jgi:hypothetical protein
MLQNNLLCYADSKNITYTLTDIKIVLGDDEGSLVDGCVGFDIFRFDLKP